MKNSLLDAGDAIQQLGEADALAILKEKLNVALRFPEKAYFTIEICHLSEPNVASWNEAGNAIIIKDSSAFEKKYLSTSFDTFRRQLQLYGFKKVNDQRSKSHKSAASREFIFTHPSFLRGRVDLVRVIQSVKNDDKVSSSNVKVPEKETVKPNKASTTAVPMSTPPVKVVTNKSRSDLVPTDSVPWLARRLIRMEQKLDDLNNRFEQLSFTLSSTAANSAMNINNKRPRGDVVHRDQAASPGLISDAQSTDYEDTKASNYNSTISGTQGAQPPGSLHYMMDPEDGQFTPYPYLDPRTQYGGSHRDIDQMTDDDFLQMIADDIDLATNSSQGSNRASLFSKQSLLIFSGLALMAVVGGLSGALISERKNKNPVLLGSEEKGNSTYSMSPSPSTVVRSPVLAPSPSIVGRTAPPFSTPRPASN